MGLIVLNILIGISVILGIFVFSGIKKAYSKKGVYTNKLLSLWFTMWAFHHIPLMLASYYGVWLISIDKTFALAGGLVLFLIGAIILPMGMIEFRSLSRSTGQDISTLITTGIYRWSRNPQFIGWFLILLGISLAGRSGFAFILTGVFAIVIYLYTILLAEPYLESLYGEEYRLFKKTTARRIRIPKRMKTIISLVFIISNVLCFGQNNIPSKKIEMLEEKSGDLDRDGIAEKVIVYNTTDTTNFGIVRELQILKKFENKWIIWKKSRNAVLKSGEGGMMREPFDGIEIKNGVLILSFSGGSIQKWKYKDKYRYQNNEFELIGHTSTNLSLCAYRADYDFNLTTGKINYKKEYETCENKWHEIYKREGETFYKKGIKINLNNRHSKEIEIVSPKFRYKLYL